MIAITFALPTESAELRGKLKSVREDSRIVFGKLGDAEVAVFHTGVGRQHCRRSLESFLRTVKPEYLISAGFAGSASDKLRVGDLIIAKNFSDPALLSHIAAERFRAAKLVTVEAVIESAEQRAHIAQTHNADAIDMETDVIAEMCAARTIPMLSLRVISDSPTAPFPVPADVMFDVARQRTNFGRLIPYLLAHPMATTRLLRFAGQINRIRANLADAITRVVAAVSGESQ